MNTFLTICLIVLPLSLLMGFAAYLARQSAKGMPVKRTPQPEHHRLCGGPAAGLLLCLRRKR